MEIKRKEGWKEGREGKLPWEAITLISVSPPKAQLDFLNPAIT